MEWAPVKARHMHKIKIRHLETLLVFMKTGSVTEAAAVLGTTQPNASKSLKQLEDSIGISLFQRSGGRLQPTPEAEILFTHAARLMEELTFFETLSVDLARLKSGFVQVATLATFGVALLPLVVEAFNTRYPEVFVQIDILDSDKIHSFVSRGNYDLGLVHHPSQEMDLMAQTLRTGSMVCILPPAHPLARQAGINGGRPGRPAADHLSEDPALRRRDRQDAGRRGRADPQPAVGQSQPCGAQAGRARPRPGPGRRVLGLGRGGGARHRDPALHAAHPGLDRPDRAEAPAAVARGPGLPRGAAGRAGRAAAVALPLVRNFRIS